MPCYVPEYRTLHNHRCENLISYINGISLLDTNEWITADSTQQQMTDNSFVIAAVVPAKIQHFFQEGLNQNLLFFTT
jgi:hypothetical protein